MPEGKKILYMCGIGNTIQDFKESLYHLTLLSGGYNIEGVFCPTFGASLDYKCYEHALRDKVCFEGARLFQKIVREFHADNAPGCTMFATLHSRGCVYGRNGLIDSRQEERDRVQALCIAPGGYIDPSLCKSVRHYASMRDFVPMLDKTGRERCRDTLTMLWPTTGAPLNDHPFTSPTFAPVIRRRIEKYMAEK